MSIKVFTPENGEVIDEGLGLVVLNPVASIAAQDTGRDAQALSNGLGIQVVAADRPGTAGFFPSRELADEMSTAGGYVKAMSRTGLRIDSQLESLQIRRTIVAGRSAGGLGALALTCGESISTQTHLFAAEPVGCEYMTVDEGVRRFRQNNAAQRKLNKTDTENRFIKADNGTLGVAAQAGRLLSMPLAFYYDKFHNQYIWASDAAIGYAAHIATEQPGIDTTLQFAEHGFVASPGIYRNRLAPLSFLRPDFVVRRVFDTTHASFDSHALMVRLLQPVVERALIR